MELNQEILLGLLARQPMEVTFPGLEKISAKRLADGAAWQALEEIVAVVRDISLDDAECFARIEAIVSALERCGIDCGGRHDFG